MLILVDIEKSSKNKLIKNHAMQAVPTTRDVLLKPEQTINMLGTKDDDLIQILRLSISFRVIRSYYLPRALYDQTLQR